MRYRYEGLIGWFGGVSDEMINASSMKNGRSQYYTDIIPEYFEQKYS